MPRKAKKVDDVVAVTERPEVYDQRADEREAKQAAAFAAAALRSASEASLREPKPQTEAEAVAESRKSLNEPLAPGQKFFESPEGYIEVGNVEDETIWCQRANGGKGLRINPRR